MEIYGVNFGEKLDCRVCRSDGFIVERGHGKVNGKPISVLTIRCHRCGTVLEQLQIDWKATPTEKDKVCVDDGVIREPEFHPA